MRNKPEGNCTFIRTFMHILMEGRLCCIEFWETTANAQINCNKNRYCKNDLKYWINVTILSSWTELKPWSKYALDYHLPLSKSHICRGFNYVQTVLFLFWNVAYRQHWSQIICLMLQTFLIPDYPQTKSPNVPVIDSRSMFNISPSPNEKGRVI